MDPIDYDAECVRLLREIEGLPPEQQQLLRALHAVSVQRHEEIQESKRQSQEALGDLQQQLTHLAEGFPRLDGAVRDLRLTAKMALFELEARRRERLGGGRSDAPPRDGAPPRDDV